MEQLSIEILQAYGKKAEVVRNIQRFATYICRIDNKEVCIKKFKGSEEEALFVHNIKEHLKRKNFKNIEDDILTLDGEPFFVHNDEFYVCYKKIDGEKLNLVENNNILFLMAELGRLHKNLNSTYIKDNIPQELSIYNNYEQFGKVKKQVMKYNKKNDIDFLFLKMYNKYEKSVLENIEELKFLDYENYEKTAIMLSDICFCSFDDNNFVIENKGIVFKDFSRARAGVQITDVAKLIYKYVKTCYEEEIKPIGINYLVDSYKRNNDLTSRELLILKAILNYPEKYFTNIFKYYEKKRSFVPTETVTKLDKYFKIEEVYYDYIYDLDI